jgi:AraC-like DNA-binding protein
MIRLRPELVTPRSPGGTASAEYLRALAWSSQARGLDPAPVLASVGIAPAVLNERGTRVSLEPVCNAWHEIVNRLDDPLFGLRSVEALGFGAMDILDYIVRNCANVGEALSQLARYLGLMTDADALTLVFDGGEVRARFRTIGLPWAIEMAVAMFATRSRELFGPGWALRSVSFQHAALGPRAAYDRIFGTTVRFRRPFDEAVFARELVDLPVPGADTRLRDILTAQADGFLSALATTSAGEVRSPRSFLEAIHQALAEGLAERDATLNRLAEHLGVSARTVQRRLREAGLSHRALVRTLRFELARRALDAPGLSQQEIARALGYSGAGAFHRAFKRWAGMTPGAARSGPGPLEPESDERPADGRLRRPDEN